MIAMSGGEDGMRCSENYQSSLPFWKIAHQRITDLCCVSLIYSGIIESDRRFENQAIGSGRNL